MHPPTVGTDLTLRSRSSVSYWTANMPALASLLTRGGYRAMPGRAMTEYGRYQRGASLVVLYHSGSVLLQGADVEAPRQLLAPLVIEDRLP